MAVVVRFRNAIGGSVSRRVAANSKGCSLSKDAYPGGRFARIMVSNLPLNRAGRLYERTDLLNLVGQSFVIKQPSDGQRCDHRDQSQIANCEAETHGSYFLSHFTASARVSISN